MIEGQAGEGGEGGRDIGRRGGGGGAWEGMGGGKGVRTRLRRNFVQHMVAPQKKYEPPSPWAFS